MDGHARYLMVFEGTALEFVAGLLGGMLWVWGTPACSGPPARGADGWGGNHTHAVGQAGARRVYRAHADRRVENDGGKSGADQSLVRRDCRHVPFDTQRVAVALTAHPQSTTTASTPKERTTP